MYHSYLSVFMTNKAPSGTKSIAKVPKQKVMSAFMTNKTPSGTKSIAKGTETESR